MTANKKLRPAIKKDQPAKACIQQEVNARRRIILLRASKNV